jgi:AAA15 family ATPase/GTPase
MLENIHIQNFRCFEDFEASGFERVNLIGGKNNSGKTCLLEAILLLRKLDVNKTEFVQQVADLRNEEIKDLFNQKFTYGTSFKDIKVAVYGNEFEFENDLRCDFSFSTEVLRDIADCWVNYNNKNEITYINQKTSLPLLDSDLLFSEVEKKDKEEIYIEFLSKIDNSIRKIKKMQFDKNSIQLKQTHNDSFVKISSYGDAVASVFKYCMPFIKRKVFETDLSQTHILLIDEIENGIHYTVQEEIWKTLFTLSKELNVQVFATTHSLEMIQQFNKVAKEEGEAAYFEMGREYETGKIFAQKHDTELLEYELEKPTSTVRG